MRVCDESGGQDIWANLLVIGASSLGLRRDLMRKDANKYLERASSCCSSSSWIPPSFALLNAAFSNKVSNWTTSPETSSNTL